MPAGRTALPSRVMAELRPGGEESAATEGEPGALERLRA